MEEFRQLKTLGAIKLGSKLSYHGADDHGQHLLTTGASRTGDDFEQELDGLIDAPSAAKPLNRKFSN